LHATRNTNHVYTTALDPPRGIFAQPEAANEVSVRKRYFARKMCAVSAARRALKIPSARWPRLPAGSTRAGDISTVAKDGGTGRQTMLVVTITTT
jgi:hypothetical protein